MDSDDSEILLPAGETLMLRPVSAEDEEFLVSVYAGTRAQEMAQVPWSDEQKKEFVRCSLTCNGRITSQSTRTLSTT